MNQLCRPAVNLPGERRCRSSHGDLAAVQHDEACLLQGSQGEGDAWAMSAEHQAQEFVREGHFVGADAINGHQELAREAFLDLAAPVSQGRGRGLAEEGMSIAQHGTMQRGAAIDCLAQVGGADAKAAAGDLNEGCVLRSIVSKHDGKASPSALIRMDPRFPQNNGPSKCAGLSTARSLGEFLMRGLRRDDQR
jgi:hypothetical protein